MSLRPQPFPRLPNMGIVSSPIQSGISMRRNPKRLHSFRWYLQRRGERSRSLLNSYRQTTNEKESTPTGLETQETA